ncbi:hypothetical protein V0288_24995 [Pannus brasiliensis CCIBt3594]|uniref:Uncharacterized protein n=1 Tax=Pannus brasiliensis CCIBt3594 TaxID=1427578 RepID=A0AAW9R1F5_9CHRO
MISGCKETAFVGRSDDGYIQKIEIDINLLPVHRNPCDRGTNPEYFPSRKYFFQRRLERESQEVNDTLPGLPLTLEMPSRSLALT